MKTANRMWVEIEVPVRGEAEVGHERARALSRVLGKLGIDYEGHPPVWFCEEKWQYAFTLSSAGCFCWAEDHGHWYSLDRAAK